MKIYPSIVKGNQLENFVTVRFAALTFNNLLSLKIIAGLGIMSFTQLSEMKGFSMEAYIYREGCYCMCKHDYITRLY